jgi:hypothetical protein
VTPLRALETTRVPGVASLEDLTDPQRAILGLLLKQGKSYDEIATLLKSSSTSVQGRARDAVRALGPETPQIGSDRHAEIADYLLGQQSASRRAATREYLEASAPGRAWARAVAGALRPLGGDNLPEIPAERSEVDQAFDAMRSRAKRQEEVQRSSQLGTRILYGAAGLVVAIVLIVVLKPGSDSGNDTPTETTVTHTTPTETPVAIAEGTLRAAEGATGSPKGQMGIIEYPQRNLFKLLIAAEGLRSAPEGAAYGVWLYTSKSENGFVGFPKGKVDSKGALDVVADLSPQTKTYREVLLTLERVDEPKKPGEIVLRGVLKVAQQPTGTQTTPQTTTQPQTATTP